MRNTRGRTSVWRQVTLVLALGLAGLAQAQAPNAEQQAAQAEQQRLADADTLLALTQDGAILYAQDAVKLSGYQYCSQAVALADQGEFRLSVRASSKALHLAKTTNDPNLTALANRDLAIAYSYAGRLDKAEDFAREALKYEAKAPEKVVGPVLKVLGDIEARRGNYELAIQQYEQSLASSSERYAPLVRLSLANALIEAGYVDRARQMLDTTEPPAEAVLATQWQRTQARLLLAAGQPRKAADLYRSLTSRQTGVDSRYYQMWAWDGVARSELALGNRSAAADALAHALDNVDAVRARFRSDEFKMGLFSDMQSVFDQAIGLYTDLNQTAAAFNLSERSRSRALLDAVRGRSALPDIATTTMSLSDLQESLAPDERVIQFHSLSDRLLAWVVGPDSIRPVTIAVSREDLIRIVDGYRELVVDGKQGAIEASARLGELLIAPLGLADGQRLVIAPHGPLHYLPFQALRLNDAYLIERHPMSVTPSISIATQLVQRTPHADALLTAFGNPRVADQYDLPGAEREVQALARLFPEKNIFMGSAATKTQFREAAGQATLIHVAAHAQADTVDPWYSRILLANEDGRQSFLEAREVIELNMSQTALVTLSACESGLGRIARGDEVLGFPRSFLSAGSASLIASLWPVSDEASERLMSTLYAELTKGHDLQRAMQAGQLAVLHEAGTAHPFFWAPFNLIGNWRLTMAGS